MSVLAGLALAVSASCPTQAYMGPVDERNRFPFVVRIEMDGKATCTGFLTDRRTVVTAAHCITKIGAKEAVVWAGSRKVRTRDLVPHPDYRPLEGPIEPACACELASAEHDIAVLRLPADLDVPTYPGILVDALPEDLRGGIVADGRTQWGALRYFVRRALPDIFSGDALKATLVGYGATFVCEDPGGPACTHDGKRRYGVHEVSRVCQGDVWCVEGRQGVKGDSGGPMLLRRSDGSYLVAGVFVTSPRLNVAMTFSSTLRNAPFLRAHGVLRR